MQSYPEQSFLEAQEEFARKKRDNMLVMPRKDKSRSGKAKVTLTQDTIFEMGKAYRKVSRLKLKERSRKKAAKKRSRKLRH